jgi:OOP family OmpA-OmpF porin
VFALRTAVAVVMLALAGAACAKRVAPAAAAAAPPPPAPPSDVVALLADPDGSIGAADVSSPHGSTALTTLRAATRVAAGQAPTAAEELSEAEIQQLFGDALAAMPPPPQRFTLYFRFESEELTAESRASISSIFEAVKGHPAPEVLVVGHTDRTGTAERNLQLGLRRATAVRDLLVASRLDEFQVEVTSHGESDPLIKTADEVFEPRNRRVDITVR